MKKNVVLLTVVLFEILFTSNASFGQADSVFICDPKEITKDRFEQVTEKILSYPFVSKTINELTSENNNYLIFLTNDLGLNYLPGIIFYLDSNYKIVKGFFTRFNLNDTTNSNRKLIALKKKELKKFTDLRIQESINHFLYCNIAIAHERWDMAFVVNNNKMDGGLYFIGGLLIDANQTYQSNPLITLRKKIRNIKISKRL